MFWQRFPIKFKLSGPAANLGARHGPAWIVRFGGTAVLFRRLPGRWNYGEGRDVVCLSLS